MMYLKCFYDCIRNIFQIVFNYTRDLKQRFESLLENKQKNVVYFYFLEWFWLVIIQIFIVINV